ncbi:hypothetical protein ISF41_22515 [Burkholderia pseudomallei]|nr:hypothetical protein [Burkholderia pseudomallei]
MGELLFLKKDVRSLNMLSLNKKLRFLACELDLRRYEPNIESIFVARMSSRDLMTIGGVLTKAAKPLRWATR